MSTTDSAPHWLTRSKCAALLGGKHRCLLNHPLPDPHPILTNSQSPIARLSNEELLLIFEAALEIVIFGATAFGHLQKPNILITVSHVSRRWRAIALSNTGLWSYIFPCSFSGVKEHLSRSRTRPLTIFGWFPPHQQVNSSSKSKKDESSAIATTLVENAYRWKALIWADGSADNTANMVCLLQNPNAYPMLELVDITIPQCIPVEMGAANASNAILFPALRTLGLTHVHPMVLPRSAMPSLLYLKLKDLGHNLYLSELLPLLSGTPALRVLMLHHALPTIDPHRVLTVGRSSPRWLPTAPLRAPSIRSRMRAVRLPALVSLSLHPAPASGLWILFLFLELPALETLDLHVYTETDPHNAHFSGLTRDGRTFVLRPPSGSSTAENQETSRDAWSVRLPALRTLLITYYIPSTSAPGPAPAPNLNPPGAPSLTQLRRIVFPNLTELQITHALAPDRPFPPLPPPPPPLPPFDALFHTPIPDSSLSFRHLARLALARCVLPLQTLRVALRARMPALEVLVLGPACLGAGALVCALAPEGCHAGEHEREREGKCERGDGHGYGEAGAWVGRGVRGVVLRQCADVRAGCLRKVIEARLRASASASASNAKSEVDSASVCVSIPSASLCEPIAGSKLGEERGLGGRPERITEMQVLECAGVTKDDMAALAAIPGTPTLYLSPPATV